MFHTTIIKLPLQVFQQHLACTLVVLFPCFHQCFPLPVEFFVLVYLEDISEECQIPIRLTNQTLYELQEINLLHEVVTDAKSQDIAYQPSMDISKLNVALLLDKLDTHGSEDMSSAV